MASTVEVPVQDLKCGFCLDVVKNATLLVCGHTFCRECLEAYDEKHHVGHIVCPVCREITVLGQNGVAGLKPNFLALGFQDKLHEILTSQSFCSLHKNVYSDIFCEDCKEFLCLKCFLEKHKDHKFRKKEELEGHLRKKRDSLINENEIAKTQIHESVNNAEEHRINIQSHFSKVENEIKDGCCKMVTVLQKKQDSLLNELGSIRKETEHQLEDFIAIKRQAIDDINTSIEELKGYKEKSVDLDTIETQYRIQRSELEKLLKKGTETESIAHLQQKAENTRFRPSDEKLLALGDIEVEEKEMNNIQQAKTVTGEKRKSEQPPAARKKVAVIPPPVRSKSLNIVGQVKARGDICCMAAQSQDAVVVGYGVSGLGSDRFSVSGEKTQNLKSEVGLVFDIAFLTDGRSVVSHHDKLRVYSTDRHSTGVQYACKKEENNTKLCVDQDDNIYADNGNSEIYIFHGNNPNPERVIPTGNIKPYQICVTKTGALITNTWTAISNTVSVFDREGHVGSSITASDVEYLFATVDSQDRVLVARVMYDSDEFRLTRYTLQGTTLILQVTFNELKLPRAMNVQLSFCCLTSLTPKLIAFSDNKNLYFIELSE